MKPLDIASALRNYKQDDLEGIFVVVSRQACDEGARFLQRYESTYKELIYTRNKFDKAIELLSGIHALLYPPPFSNKEGIVLKFHSPCVHEQMQALSDRIKALPDEIEQIKQENEKE